MLEPILTLKLFLLADKKIKYLALKKIHRVAGGAKGVDARRLINHQRFSVMKMAARTLFRRTAGMKNSGARGWRKAG